MPNPDKKFLQGEPRNYEAEMGMSMEKRLLSRSGLTANIIRAPVSYFIAGMQVGLFDSKKNTFLLPEGLSHFVEQTVPVSSARFSSAADISRSVSEYGGIYRASVYDDFLHFYIMVNSAAGAEPAITALEHVLSTAQFSMAQVQNELGSLDTEIRKHQQNPLEILYDRVRQMLYKDNYLGKSKWGTQETLQAVRKDPGALKRSE